MIKEETNKLETEINFFLNPKKIIFTDQMIIQKLNDTELTNDYKKPWTSLELYIKTMFNLSIENYMYSFRKHLNELKNGEMDPRDLRLYEKVTICPSFEFDEKMDFDIFIKFSIRENGQSIKIDWENTERLSFPNLLFFRFRLSWRQLMLLQLQVHEKEQSKTISFQFQCYKEILL